VKLQNLLLPAHARLRFAGVQPSTSQEIPKLSQRRQGVSIVDALTSGLAEAARRPWLMAIPFALDLFIWLAPPLSVKTLLERLVIVWEALVRGTYPPEQAATMLKTLPDLQQIATQAGAEMNLFHYLTGSWPGIPSALTAPQSARLTFISDMIFAPVGLGPNLPRVAASPWQRHPLEVSSVWVAFLLALVLWLIGQGFVALFLHWAANRPVDDAEQTSFQAAWSGPKGLVLLFGNLVVLSLILGVAMLFLRIPLAVLLTVIYLTGSSGGALLFAVIGGITLWMVLWFLSSLYFASDAIVLDHQSVLRSMMLSARIARLQSFPIIGMAILVNLLMVGFRAVWGLIGQNAVGAVVAMAGNAFLGTAMILGIFAYYQDRRRMHEALVAESRRQSNLRNQLKD